MIVSQLEVIEQANTYLSQMNQAAYTEVISPFFVSSAGAHMRHIIDHYLALQSGLTQRLIDYDLRTRGGTVELCPLAAQKVLADITRWLTTLESLSTDELACPLQVSTEVSISNKQIALVPSSLARELVFVGSHAVHHFAMIGQIVQHQTSNNEISLPQGFGIAPATVSYVRENS